LQKKYKKVQYRYIVLFPAIIAYVLGGLFVFIGGSMLLAQMKINGSF